jgi:hypothetical protein
MFDLKVLDCILYDRQRVEVGRSQDVGNVTVDEDVTGLKAENGRLWASRVRAAYPEDLGRLPGGEAREKVRIRLVEIGSPFSIGRAKGGGVSIGIGCWVSHGSQLMNEPLVL